MKFRRTPRATRRDNRTRAGFTFAEVLAALLFMAIVIPTAVEGVRIANLAGQVSARKNVATRIAQNYLTELRVSGQWQRGIQNGTVQEGAIQYRWVAQVEPWTQTYRSTGSLRLLTVQVLFLVQGREYDVRVSTLIDTAVS
jgi:Tfp pilus assembly protein PilV